MVVMEEDNRLVGIGLGVFVNNSSGSGSEHFLRRSSKVGRSLQSAKLLDFDGDHTPTLFYFLDQGGRSAERAGYKAIYTLITHKLDAFVCYSVLFHTLYRVFNLERNCVQRKDHQVI